MFGVLFGLMMLLLMAVCTVGLVGTYRANKRRSVWMLQEQARLRADNERQAVTAIEFKARSDAAWAAQRERLDRLVERNEERSAE